MKLISLLLLTYLSRLVTTYNTSFLLDDIIYPSKNYSLNTRNIYFNFSNYSYQYYNNSLWIDSDKWYNSKLFEHRLIVCEKGAAYSHISVLDWI